MEHAINVIWGNDGNVWIAMGDGIVVPISQAEYDNLLENIYVRKSKANYSRLLESIEEAKAGKLTILDTSEQDD